LKPSGQGKGALLPRPRSARLIFWLEKRLFLLQNSLFFPARLPNDYANVKALPLRIASHAGLAAAKHGVGEEEGGLEDGEAKNNFFPSEDLSYAEKRVKKIERPVNSSKSRQILGDV